MYILMSSRPCTLICGKVLSGSKIPAGGGNYLSEFGISMKQAIGKHLMYIGFNDLSCADADLYEVDEGTYEKKLEDILIEQIRLRGGVTALLQPIEGDDPNWAGYRRMMITVGPSDV
jgi:hypothetical protein